MEEGMNTSDNCQNCDSKDKVTIAGKTFCANCGSVAQNTTSQTTASTTITQPSDNSTTRPAGNIVSSAIAVNGTKSDLVSSLTNSLSQNQSTTDSSNMTVQSKQTTAPQSPKTVQPTDQTTHESYTQPAQVSSIKKFAQSNNTTPIQSAQTQQMQTIQPQPLDLSNNSQYTSTDQSLNTTTAEPQVLITENHSNELSSLNSKDEDVFSDAQFHELSQTSNERPIDIDNLSQKPSPQSFQPVTNSDITPRITSSPQVQTTNSNSQLKTTAVPMSDIRPQHAPVIPSQPRMTTPSVAPLTQPSQQPTIQTIAQPSPVVAAMIDQGQTNTAPSKENKHSKKGAKAGTIALTAVGLLLLGAYVWQVNYPNLALKVASGKAGINASVPNYLPNGWQISGNINSSPGLVSYQLSSKDGKKATINESKTDWDSQALAENYVNYQSDKYLALQAAGLTIYVYNNQASWVNNGTWYRIEGTDTGLSQDQLIRMATSL